MEQFDVVIVGGGHAGCEAALAAARRGAHVALVTHDRATIGAMSCNPAIGGVGKGHIVREVDVFGGLIATAADTAAIHYRMLNRSRGRAVWGPRIQADRERYRLAAGERLKHQSNLCLIEGEACRAVIAGERVAGLMLADGTTLHATALVIASGTFLRACMFTGRASTNGGRHGEPAANMLADQLRELGGHGRLKTGTPPRLDGRTIDWARLPRQESDADPWTMAPYTPAARLPQIACAITRTNPSTHAIIADAADRSPLFAGDIEGQGPRYCPSIEDKVRRFADRDGHQIFLEPEGLSTPLVYPNGISTSLPADVQAAFVRSIEGLECADIVQPGYAVEYDYLDPRRLLPTLEHRGLPGLFLAGQVNGTTGYEEAAGQGLVAGLNAAARALDIATIEFDRRDSYIGVMIDDLTLQGVSEPYRMLTARAEHRLHLRSDNAEVRLLPLAIEAGCLTADEHAAAAGRMARRAAPGEDDPLIEEVRETERYAPYVERERRQAQAAAVIRQPIDPTFDFDRVPGLSVEMRERLTSARPRTIAEAQRIRGITPAAISALLVANRRQAA